MSNDYYVVSGDSLREVADTIREKNNTSEQLAFPDGWIDTINSIKTDDEEEIPNDGKTRIWVYIPEDTPDNKMTFCLNFSASTANNTTIDWGDGTTQTLGSTTATNYSHKYSQSGNYLITITINNGTISFGGSSASSGNSIYGSRSSSGNNYYNHFRITRIIFGNNANITNYTCAECYNLTSVTILNNITSIGTSTFSDCYALKSITIPNTVKIIYEKAFYQCYTLRSITIPNSVTTISNSVFYNCYALRSITIPNGVTTISSNTFRGCYNMSEYHFKATTPPTLGSTMAFGTLPSDCIIYVPYSADHSVLNAYKTATNWSTFANYMQEEPQ